MVVPKLSGWFIVEKKQQRMDHEHPINHLSHKSPLISIINHH